MNLKKVRGVTIKLPSDKSIAHRWILLSLMASNDYELKNLDVSEDLKASLEAVNALGVKVIQNGSDFRFTRSNPNNFLSQPIEIDCKNSGTTARLLMGILCAHNSLPETILLGDESLSKRPMKRVIEPLSLLGASIENKEYLPIKVSPTSLAGGKTIQLKVASAQVKSAILFASLFSKETILIQGAIHSRDHTERLLRLCHINLVEKHDALELSAGIMNNPTEYEVPGDPSAAAFWCLFSYLSDQPVEFSNMLINPTRLGFFDVIKKMGMKVEMNSKSAHTDYEPIARVLVESLEPLSGIHIRSEEVPRLIDEILLLAVFMAKANSKSVIEGVEELKYKESDRLHAFELIARAFGAEVIVQSGSVEVYPNKLKADYNFDQLLTSKDHRVIMCLAVISKALKISMPFDFPEHVSISYPAFWKTLENL